MKTKPSSSAISMLSFDSRIILAVPSSDQLNDIGMSVGCNLMRGFFGTSWSPTEVLLPRQAPGRLKQWLSLMRRSYPQAERLFHAVREARRAPEVNAILAREGLVAEPRVAA